MIDFSINFPSTFEQLVKFYLSFVFRIQQASRF